MSLFARSILPRNVMGHFSEIFPIAAIMFAFTRLTTLKPRTAIHQILLLINQSVKWLYPPFAKKAGIPGDLNDQEIPLNPLFLKEETAQDVVQECDQVHAPLNNGFPCSNLTSRLTYEHPSGAVASASSSRPRRRRLRCGYRCSLTS